MDTTKLQKLIDNRAKVAAGGGEAAVEKHHAKGSYTARERINMLLDEGSFEEVNMSDKIKPFCNMVHIFLFVI